jgi:hypothetical protein
VTSQVSHPYNNTQNSKMSNKINGSSKPGNLLQTNIQGTENSHHSFTIRFGCDKLFKKTPPVCRAKLKYSHSTRRKMDIYIQSYKSDLYKRSAVNMGSKLFSKLPDYIIMKKSYNHFRKELKYFLLLHTFYSMVDFVAL